MNPHHILKILAGFFIVTSSTSWGLTSDNNQLLHISSNQATVDFKAGKVSYEGNVNAQQGSRRLSGDKLILSKAPQGGVQNVIAYGNPAKTQYQPTAQSEIAHGQAQIITYIFPTHIFKFEDQAWLEQSNNIFKGPLIIYNANTKVVHSPTNTLEPTTIILPPYDQEKLPHD